jgi:hypothetical protein
MKNGRIVVYKPTQNDWCGNHTIEIGGEEIRLVRVSLIKMTPFMESKIEWRVCVWGNDDFGMDYDCIEKDEAMKIFQEVIALEYVNVVDLTSRGFINA